MPIGQVILGVRDLDVAADEFLDLGLHVDDGGVHPGLGTANRIVALGNAYIELLGVVDLVEAEASPFGRALLSRITHGDAWVRWSIRTGDIDAASARLGLTAEPRRRLRPDGTLLTWRSAGIDLSWREPWLPFFMQWDDPAQYPGIVSRPHPAGPCSLAWLEVSTSDRGRLDAWTSGVDDLPLRVRDGDPGIDAVAIATPAGEVVVGPVR